MPILEPVLSEIKVLIAVRECAQRIKGGMTASLVAHSQEDFAALERLKVKGLIQGGPFHEMTETGETMLWLLRDLYEER